MSSRRQPTPRGAAFLLAQIGAHAAERFAQRVQQLGLTPPDVGLLRMIAAQPGRSQQSVAVDLGVVPSRVVALVDNLDHKGLVERRPGETDRRHHALHLTAEGEQLMMEMRTIASAHDDDICAALNGEERVQLAGMLQRIAEQQGLTPGVHPGFRHLGARRRPNAEDGAVAADGPRRTAGPRSRTGPADGPNPRER
ncbi:MarR family winged helix-turn-helix transcriptional regulator [Dactylosporangium salmoneum]